MTYSVLMGLGLGTLFGAALYFVGASNQKNIIAMLRLENLRLMKIILGSIGWGSILLGMALWLGLVDSQHINIKATHLGVIIGGLIFGIGFALARSCPGTCLVGLGRGSLLSLMTVLGGLVGAFLFTVSYPWFVDLGVFDTLQLGALPLFTLRDDLLGVFSVGPWALSIMGVVFMGIALVLPEKRRH